MNENFRSEVAARFSEAIRTRNLTMEEAARQIGVSRQMLHRYLKATAAPRSITLKRACEAWGITLSYRGLQFGSAAFGNQTSTTESKQTTSNQYTLFGAIQALNDRSLEVKVLRKSARSIDLHVRVKFSS